MQYGESLTDTQTPRCPEAAARERSLTGRVSLKNRKIERERGLTGRVSLKSREREREESHR